MTIDVRGLGPGDLAALVALHDELHVGAARRRPAGEARAVLATCLDGRGAIVGAIDRGRLRGYAVVIFPDADDEDNLARALALPADEHPRAAIYAGAGVHSDVRGQRVHEHLNECRLALARARRCLHVLGAVPTTNLASLATHLRAGLRARAVVNVLGAPHYLVHRDLRAVPTTPTDAVAVPLADLPAQRARFAAGWSAFALTPRRAADTLWFARVG